MKDTWSTEEVHNLLGMVLSNLRISKARTHGAIPIKDVAEACGFAPSSLLKDCRADLFEHCNYGDGRSMTPDQIEKFLAKVTRGGSHTVTKTAPRDEMAAARAATLKSAGRKAPRRLAS